MKKEAFGKVVAAAGFALILLVAGRGDFDAEVASQTPMPVWELVIFSLIGVIMLVAGYRLATKK